MPFQLYLIWAETVEFLKARLRVRRRGHAVANPTTLMRKEKMSEAGGCNGQALVCFVRWSEGGGG